MKTKLMMMGVLATVCTAIRLAAMPTEEETRRAEPVVKKLLASERAALNSGTMTRSEVAAAAMGLADKAESDAEKLLLMKGACDFYVHAGEFDKAIETLQTIMTKIPDIPYATIVSILESSLRGVPRNSAKYLYAFLDETKSSLRNTDATHGKKVQSETNIQKFYRLFPGWEICKDAQKKENLGFALAYRGQFNVAVLHPVSEEIPAVVSRTLKLSGKNPCLFLKVSSCDYSGEADWVLSVRVNGKEVLPKRLVIKSPISEPWEDIAVPLFAWRGQEVKVEVVVAANGWFCEFAYFKCLEIAEGSGRENLIPEATETVGGYTWSYRVQNGEATIISEKEGKDSCAVSPNPVGSIVIPATLGGAKVTSIGRGALACCQELESVTIPQGVKRIGRVAFFECKKLKSVEIPSSVTEIDWCAFYRCNALASVAIPSDSELKTLENGAFAECFELKSIAIPDGVTRIARHAFLGCFNIKSLTIPATASNIGGEAFRFCANLSSVTMLGEKPDTSVPPVNRSHTSDNIFLDCGKLNAIHVPANAKSWEGMKEWQGIPLVFDGDVEAEGSGNSGQDVEYKFNYKLDNNGNAILTGMPCVSPKPEGVLIVPSIIEGHKVTKLDEHLSFVNCDKMTKLILPAGLESVGFGNFLKGCSSLADIEISKTNPNFTSFKGVLYSKDMKKVVAYPKAREKIELSPQTKIIGRGAFCSCTFKEIEVPSGIERIESHAFVAMLNLEKIVFPASVNEIWMQLFQEDSNLRKIIFVGNAPEVHIEGIYGFFAYAPENIVIEVKKGTKGWNGKDSTDIPERWPKSQFGDRDSRPIRYIGEEKAKNNGLAGANGQTATVDGYTWSYFIKNGEATVTAAVSPSPKGDITIPATLGGVKVTGLGEKIFYQCKEVTSVTIPEGVTSIGPSAFDFCFGLKSVTIPSSVKTIGNWAFSACFQLQSVTLPESLEYIGIGGFINCRSLKTVNIPAKLNEIGGAAFAYCTGLKQFMVDAENETFTAIDGALYSKDWSTLVSAPNVSTIARMPSTITKIGRGAFQGCDRLEKLTIPASVTLIDCGAFHDCGRLGSMTIPAGVAKIEGGAFYNCGELTEVTMLGERPEAPNAIFNKNCGKLKSIHVPANAKSWAGMKDWFGIPLVFDAK